jgi:hypothetical protein
MPDKLNYSIDLVSELIGALNIPHQVNRPE